jgi:hypothetical protein
MIWSEQQVVLLHHQDVRTMERLAHLVGQGAQSLLKLDLLQIRSILMLLKLHWTLWGGGAQNRPPAVVFPQKRFKKAEADLVAQMTEEHQVFPQKRFKKAEADLVA